MKIVDLSFMMSSDFPVFPGAPPLEIGERFSIKEMGFRVSDIKIDTHAGTHADAPAHMIENAGMMEEFPIEQFFGPAFMMDVSQFAGGKISLDEFLKYEEDITKAEFLILNSGWYKKLGTDAYNEGFPNPTVEAARWIANLNQLKGVGTDIPSLDHHGIEPLEVHKTLMGKKKLIVESLTNLCGLPSKFLFSCFPLKLKDADGAPCRAVAIIDLI
jgi:kynurenine formamidase